MKSKLFAQYFKKKRKEKGLTQKDVADKMNYTTSQFISAIERSISLPPANDLEKLAILLNVNKNELATIWYENKITDIKNEFYLTFKRYGIACETKK